MATITFDTGGVEIQAQAQVSATTLPTFLQDVPGGLYPLRSAVWDVDEYRMMAGWPVEIPPYDVHAISLVSASGEVLNDRDAPSSLATGASARWISDSSFYDNASLRWYPVQSSGSTLVWETTSTYAPVLIDDYQYRIETERFNRSVLNFDSDSRSHMFCTFRDLLVGASGYTVIMVLNPNSSYGNNVTVPYNGLWCPGRPTGIGDTFSETLDANWLSVTMQGQYLYYETEAITRARVISIASSLNNNAPLYVAMVFGRPTTTFYVGAGPSSIRSASVAAGPTPVPLDSGIVLGRSTGDVLHTADMALMDLGIYSDMLTGLEVRDEFALLSRVYGGDT
jgi:hypothetical protein